MNRERVVEVVAAVIEHDGRVLACRRRPKKAAGGKWEFPGGKIEPHETPESALVREIQEELSIGIEVVSRLRTDETQVGDSVIRLICLRARLTGDAPTVSLDHDELRWLAPESLPELDWAAPDLPAVAELAGRA
ncbi:MULTISPECIES: (deoxy)nucleoside triphosphate pyrophosphohydrolase [unclassified Microbacterium]|uniref:(deoxy)nucleoside triphosphate pyrophosphohydrolase n=1 Tax=unclassified Microbacterium TaxID=2609290 RepID=UPI000EAA45B9|nr:MULTISPECIES: (deoxy)nucleoside triphosphate pyrophosphohydrolase [unclassified Microbacterium]MBT2484278.1 (deoxy)nucleoside triphosphate pyrophosphohydrolase [Microbacterium sp. ISL-108]RKN67199.1 (deoxy)nucleoside triphosphate pyrophosphohydrolase [Microbacterium sp. CGR2]